MKDATPRPARSGSNPYERLSERLESLTRSERQEAEAEMIHRLRRALWGNPPPVKKAPIHES